MIQLDIILQAIFIIALWEAMKWILARIGEEIADMVR